MELRVDFESQREWSAWHDKHVGTFAAWTECIAEFVRSHGYVEPLTGIHVSPSDVRIDRDSYRESLASDGLNSRKRALLLEFNLLSQRCEQFRPRNIRIFSPEVRTRTATILGALYPNFLGAEYGDFLALNMPDAINDLVALSDEAWTHVAKLSRAIDEIARVLRPGGALIATCRFAFHSADSLPDSKIAASSAPLDHVKEKLSAESDQSVESNCRIPGWDILDMCRQAGLNDARMILHGSAVHGITGDYTPGVFVLSAIKSGSCSARPRCDWLWKSKRINRVIGVLGIPRSGTTMFTAVLDAHSDIVSIYEPWNVQKSSTATRRSAITSASLLDEAERQDHEATALLIKETGLDPAYGKNLAAILAEAAPPLSHHLLILLRNPFHCFLSEVEGRRKWWGEANLEVNEVLFDRWAQRSLASLSQMMKLGERCPGAIVFYEACASNPLPTFSRIMEILGLEFSPKQLRISENIDVSRIRGDLSLVENARDVADASISKRRRELEQIVTKFSGSVFF
jgi:hypothetical protein